MTTPTWTRPHNPDRRPRRSRRPVSLAVAALVALVLAACGGGGEGDPATVLADAVEQTGSQSFAFEVTINTSGEAEEQFTADLPFSADQLRLAGRRGEGAFALSIGAEDSELVQMQLAQEDRTLYLMGDIGQFASLAGGAAPDPQQLLGLLEQLQLPGQIAEVARAFVQGEWVGLVLPEDTGEQTAGLPMPVAPSEAEELRDAFQQRFEDPEAFLEQYATIETSDTEAGRRFALTIQLKELLREVATIAREADSQLLDPTDIEAQIEDAPEEVSGLAVTVADGVVTQVEMDVLEFGRAVAASGGTDGSPAPISSESIPGGTFTVQMDLSDHGNIEAIEAPADAVTIPLEQLMQLGGSLLGGSLGAGGS